MGKTQMNFQQQRSRTFLSVQSTIIESIAESMALLVFKVIWAKARLKQIWEAEEWV